MITKGQKINDRYEIVKSIGEGGMANVYLAYDIILNRKVAIKVLRGDLANDEKFIRRFQREAIAASSLSHPNIVEMYDVGEDNGTYYIVMEYVEGRTLKQLLKKRGNLTTSEVIDIMLQLTDGIAHAHDSYIIHRDLKPQNIMIADDGAIKITDFGIAMALNSTQLTQTNSVMGSVHYLPPEQASGKGSTIKSDIYSMGIMFFELITGKLPFKGDNAVEIALKHMKDDIPSVRKINPNLPQSIENIVLKSTAKNPKNRYNDVKEMYNDLKVALNEENLNQPKYEYKFPEHDIEEKEISLQEEKNDKEEKEEPVAKQITEEEKSTGFNVIIWILVIIFLAGIVGLVVILYPTFKGSDDIKIPDVSDLTLLQAEKALVSEGFKISDEVCQEYSETVPAGKVIRTEPKIGSLRPEGTTVKVCESLGKNDTYIIEDYTGKNYLTVQTTLEKLYKMKVVVEKKDVEITDDMDLQAIVGQSLAKGTEIIVSEDNPTEIILYIPDVYEQYPDFVSEGWTIEEIQEFANKYNLNLDIIKVPSTEFPEGTIISQSRTGRIVEGASFNIRVTVLPEVIQPSEDETEKEEVEDNNSNNDTTNNTDSNENE
ncbi:MAG: Stk1 family PASTA domain-containing Ser/Thr kinase [Bacilli bacterium]|nr:Stk1 family PASTA domain-containing Ser/Thr kinase [Bacilli bacterium]